MFSRVRERQKEKGPGRSKNGIMHYGGGISQFAKLSSLSTSVSYLDDKTTEGRENRERYKILQT